ncbi:MAG TPA: hypothetical protein VFO05_01115 [Candidatus Limnocylindrales bacterium]|nr:hypothetical protein [Candidatus Limnocylindrales bacterium]
MEAEADRHPLVEPTTGWPLVARIWRTVDVDRTVAGLGVEGDPLGPDELLGARGVLVRPDDGPPVAILEPSTEGPLAAALARADEGDAGAYVAAPGGLDGARAVAALGVGREAAGPFGRSALAAAVSGGIDGTFIVIVDSPPATIDR